MTGAHEGEIMPGGKAPRVKGHAFERWVAKRLREAMPGCDAKRGIQTRYGGGEAADVISPKLPYHIECKRGKVTLPRRALAQAIRDAKPGRIPIAVCKDDLKDPYVILGFEDFLEIATEIYRMAEQ